MIAHTTDKQKQIYPSDTSDHITLLTTVVAVACWRNTSWHLE